MPSRSQIASKGPLLAPLGPLAIADVQRSGGVGAVLANRQGSAHGRIHSATQHDDGIRFLLHDQLCHPERSEPEANGVEGPLYRHRLYTPFSEGSQMNL